MTKAALCIALWAFPLAWLAACDGTSGDLFVEKDPDTGVSEGGTMNSDTGGGGAAGGGGVAQECISPPAIERVGDCSPMDQWLKEAQGACGKMDRHLDPSSVEPIDPGRCPMQMVDGITYRCCTQPPPDGCAGTDISDPNKCLETWMLKLMAEKKCADGGLLLSGFSLSGGCVAGTDAMGKEIPGFTVAKFACCPPPPRP